MKKKDRKFIIEMNQALVNQLEAKMSRRSTDVDVQFEKCDRLEGEEYIKSLQEEERIKNYNMNVEYKEFQLKYSDLKKQFKQLKSYLEKQRERVICMGERLKIFNAELKKSEKKGKRLEKRVNDLEECMLLFISQTELFYVNSAEEFNREARRYRRRKKNEEDVNELFGFYGYNMIGGPKYRDKN